jgi:hypothetical protein
MSLTISDGYFALSKLQELLRVCRGEYPRIPEPFQGLEGHQYPPKQVKLQRCWDEFLSFDYQGENNTYLQNTCYLCSGKKVNGRLNFDVDVVSDLVVARSLSDQNGGSVAAVTVIGTKTPVKCEQPDS